jgi:dihydrofolate reductase
MRKIIVYIAMSADGFIGRPDGSVDWLHRPRTAGEYGMGEFRERFNTSTLQIGELDHGIACLPY